jgi:hypothetical protein
MKWYLRACPNCSGDLHDDPQEKGWVSCFMCGRSFRVTVNQKSSVNAKRESAPEVEPMLVPSELPAAA